LANSHSLSLTVRRILIRLSFENTYYDVARGGKVPDPEGAVAKFVELEPRVKGAKTVKVRYGPYKVPNMTVKNIAGEEGTLWNYPDNYVKKPCDECYVVGWNAGLEWPNGKNANINEGMWLHHVSFL
jgi:hypothetical protein